MWRDFARVVPRGWGRRKRWGWQGGVSAGRRGGGWGVEGEGDEGEGDVVG